MRGRSFIGGVPSLRWRQRNPFVDRPEVTPRRESSFDPRSPTLPQGAEPLRSDFRRSAALAADTGPPAHPGGREYPARSAEANPTFFKWCNARGGSILIDLSPIFEARASLTAARGRLKKNPC